MNKFLNYVYKKLDFYNKKVYANFLNYNKKKELNKEFTYFVNKYGKYIEYNIDNESILSYFDFIMLVKDSFCVPFWNDEYEPLPDSDLINCKLNI